VERHELPSEGPWVQHAVVARPHETAGQLRIRLQRERAHLSLAIYFGCVLLVVL
jgi:hypothetical protein